MGGQGFLGEFELVVMGAVLRVGDGAYAVSVREEIKRRTGRQVSRGSIYVTLDRLVHKGYLASTMSDPTPERGGKAKRLYSATSSGVYAVKESRAMLDHMLADIDLLSEPAP